MKIKEKKLRKIVKESIKEIIKETAGLGHLLKGLEKLSEISPIDRASVWEAVVEQVPEYNGVAWDEEGVIIEIIGQNDDDYITWVVIAEPDDMLTGGWLVKEIPIAGGNIDSGEVDYDVKNIGLEAAKDEYYSVKDRSNGVTW